MKNNFNIELLKKYFSEFYPFESWGHFGKPEFDIDGHRLVKYRPEYDLICILCNEYKINDSISDLFGVFLISNMVHFHNEHTKTGKHYKTSLKNTRELFQLFDLLISTETVKNENPDYSLNFIIKSKSYPVTGSYILDEVKETIFNLVAKAYDKPEWETLDIRIQSEIIESVDLYLDENKPSSGHPPKTTYIASFVQTLKKYIVESVPVKFDTQRQLNLFVGKLAIIYKIIPKPDNNQSLNFDEYCIKRIENLCKSSA